MTTDAALSADAAQARLAAWLPLAAWCTYAPLGAKYTTWMIATAIAAQVVHRQRAWRAVFTAPHAWPLLAFGLWMGLSALWSAAPPDRQLAHAWFCLMPLSTLLLARACTAQAALRFVSHFVWASGVVGALWCWAATIGLPWSESALWGSTVQATGNQRIASSTLLALGAVLAGWLASRETTAARRALMLGLAALAVAGLAVQDRRTGMLLLPLLLLVWALAAPMRRGAKTAVVAAVLVAAAASVWLADGVRGRLEEGRREVLAYAGGQTGAVTSWGLRLLMAERSLAMIEARPWAGHGLGSWQGLWLEQVPAAVRKKRDSTPHNEYLLAAVQAGVPAGVLLLAWWLAMIGRALRAGSLGVPALMVWSSIALLAVAHAVMRDPKLALPFWVLAGVVTGCISINRPRFEKAG